MWQPNGNQVLAQRAWVSGALYSEADFESTTVPLYAFGLNYEHNDFHRTTTGNDLKSNVVGFDGVFKFKGFSRPGEYFWRERDAGDRRRSSTPTAYYMQAGMMLNRRRTWEAAFRYGDRVRSTTRSPTTTSRRCGEGSATTTAGTRSSSRWTSAGSRPASA